MVNATHEIIVWLLSLLKDLHVDHTHHAVLFCDNQAAPCIAADSIFHEEIKHVAIDCHIV